VHGLGSSGYMEWRFNLPRLARHHAVFAPDLPGFGRSAKPRVTYGVPLFERSVTGYLEKLDVASPVLVGTSMGGRVAIEVALRHPKLMQRLVLVNALGLGRPRLRLTYPLVTVPRLGEALLGLMRTGLRRGSDEAIRGLARRYLGVAGDLERTMDEEYLADLRELHEAEGYHEAYLATVRSLTRPGPLAHSRDLVAALARSRIPVLLIWGAEDRLFPLEHALRAHREIPGSRLAVIDGAGHTPQAERPDEFNEALESFLDG
jgi:pimeloyl-ACP methyl ester carboxylesterase